MRNSDRIITYDIKFPVQNRKYDVDVSALCDCLISHKKLAKLTNSQISQMLGVPLTKVEHWFRRDVWFSIPDADIWYDLKDLLHIQTDEFDLSITCFEITEGTYDMANRAYLSYGLCPTLDTGCDRICVITDA